MNISLLLNTDICKIIICNLGKCIVTLYWELINAIIVLEYHL